MLTFAEFQSRVNSTGLRARDCGSGHWQIIGGVNAVNFYAQSKNGPCIYINGTNKGVHGKTATLENAIHFARFGTLPAGAEPVRAKRLRRKQVVREKSRLYASDSKCFWCETPFESFEQTTLDHKIPLAQGGSNRRDNLVLACHSCNKERGSKAIDPSKTAPWQSPATAVAPADVAGGSTECAAVREAAGEVIDAEYWWEPDSIVERVDEVLL